VQRGTTGPVGAIRLDCDNVPTLTASLALGVRLGELGASLQRLGKP